MKKVEVGAVAGVVVQVALLKVEVVELGPAAVACVEPTTSSTITSFLPIFSHGPGI